MVELGFSGVGDYLREVIAIARIFPGVIVRGVRLSLGGIFPGGIFPGVIVLGVLFWRIIFWKLNVHDGCKSIHNFKSTLNWKK